MHVLSLCEWGITTEYALVKAVHEYYADFFAITPHLFSCALPDIFASIRAPGFEAYCKRAVDALVGVLLSSRRRPVIRTVAGQFVSVLSLCVVSRGPPACSS